MAGAKLGLAGLAGIVSALFVPWRWPRRWRWTHRAPWARIAVRVAGRLGGCGRLLLLGWSLRAA